MGNDNQLLQFFPHITLGLFKHREHVVPDCFKSFDWDEQVKAARRRYSLETNPDRIYNPGIPIWTFKTICPYEKNELVLA